MACFQDYSLLSCDEFNDKNFFEKRNLNDSLRNGYLTTQEWIQIKKWVDKVEPAYVLEECMPTGVKDDYMGWKEKQLRRCANGGVIPKQTDIPQRKVNGCIEHKEEKKSACVPRQRDRTSSSKRSNFNKIRVIGLPPELKTRDVVKIFAEFGRIVSTLHLSSTKPDGRRCAIITFAENESAYRAVESMNRKRVSGFKIKVKSIR